MHWQVKIVCSCGNHKVVGRHVKKKDFLCDCGGEFKPVLYQYDIDVCMLGGKRYIDEELAYWAKYEPMKGLKQWQVGGAGFVVDTDPECTCDDGEGVCEHCLAKYEED